MHELNSLLFASPSMVQVVQPKLDSCKCLELVQPPCFQLLVCANGPDLAKWGQAAGLEGNQ